MSDAADSQRRLCRTGIPGLDDILQGGLQRNRIFLVQGDPGVGKTTLGLQYLLEGLRSGETCLYITLSESKEELLQVAESHGWSLEGIHLFELSALQAELAGEVSSTFFNPSDVELTHTSRALLQQVERVNPDRIVFDSLSEMRMLAETPLRYRRQILQLKQFFAGRHSSVLLLDDGSGGAKDLQIESIAHGVIYLTRTSPQYGIARRQLIIQKIRGAHFREGFHDLVIKKGGMNVFPRLVAADHSGPFERETFPSGIPGLDSLLGGGLDRGTSSMFLGPPGTGKSTFALHFALAAAKREEKALIFIFDETVENLVHRSMIMGMDVRPHIESGCLQIEQIDPAEISPGELGHRIQRSVMDHKTRVVVIDSINGYLNAMPEEHYLNLQLHELLTFLGRQGVITIMVLAQHGVVGSLESLVDLTYMADSVVVLRYFEAEGEIRQAVSVIKKRSGNHERKIREMSIGEGGILVGDPIKIQGVLGGYPTIHKGPQTDPSKE